MAIALDHGLGRSPRRALGPLAQRIMRTLLGTEESTPPPGAAEDGPDAVVDQLQQRFPLARRGYDRAAVDNYVGGLEQELAALDRELAESRGQGPPQEVAEEIKRIGEQTAAILIAAHQQREEILRKARADADRCVAEARATANALTAQCEERLRALQAQNNSAEAERDRLLGELRSISEALATVADSAAVADPAAVH